jgi:rare lipoprotein A
LKPSWAGFFAAILSFAGCQHRPPPAPPLAASPHYELGKPYAVDGHWYYPAENYGLDVTGIAAVDASGAGLTADGEVRDPGALTAAMQTIQLPAIASVVNLANGRQILVRVNDRGPANPARVIALSLRAALLLQVSPGGAPVRVTLDTGMSHRVVDQLGGGPKLAIAAAPASTVTAEALPPPGAPLAHGPATVIGAVTVPSAGPRVPDRLPEVIHASPVTGGEYWLHAGTFGRFTYANQFAARLAGIGGDVVRSREGRQEVYAVRAGPFHTIAEADAALKRAFSAGIPDATIRYE